MYIWMHERDIHHVYEFIITAFYISDNKRKLHCKFSLHFFYLFLPYNRCKFCWVHSRKWMSEVYKVGDTLLISFLLSTPFLRSISFRNRTRYYFANNSSLRFCRDGKNIDLALSLPLDAKNAWGKLRLFFIHLSRISIDRELHAHPAGLHLLREFYFASARYKFANNTNLRFLYKIEEKASMWTNFIARPRGKKWKQDFFRILPQSAMDRS